jgi:hypothetical protein
MIHNNAAFQQQANDLVLGTCIQPMERALHNNISDNVINNFDYVSINSKK